MIDVGLLLSAVAAWAVVAGSSRWVPPAAIAGKDVADLLLGPFMAGLIAARLAYVALEDPAALGSVRTLLVIRGGVEFWAGAGVLLVVLALGLRRRTKRHVDVSIAELAPFVLWGYAAYEAACLVRDGCYGPASAIGFVPDGLRTRMFPVGVAVAVGVAALGVFIRLLWRWEPLWRILLALGGVAAVRAVAALWLPHLGEGPPREQVESAAVAVGVAVAAAAMAITRSRRRRAFPAAGSALPADPSSS